MAAEAARSSDSLQARAAAPPAEQAVTRVPVKQLGPAGARQPGGSFTAAAAAASSSSKAEDWLDLLGTPEPDMFGSRARSASDAAVLRRKGHLK